MKKTKKIISMLITLFIMSSIFAVNAYALRAATKRTEVFHDGTMGSAFSSEVAVNTTTDNGTMLAWNASVTNVPTSTKYTSAQVEWKLYRRTEAFSDLGSKTGVTVGNTQYSGTVTTILGGSQKTYTHFNNLYKFYIKVVLCPPAYKYTTTFNVGGVFYGT